MSCSTPFEILLNWMDFYENGFNGDENLHFYTQASKVLYMAENKNWKVI